MSTSDKTTLGDRMKSYEQPSTSRKAFKGQPLIARLDGKNFHTFTRGLKRPYDERLSALMLEVTMALVDRFQAIIGYTQSDEITLVWHSSTTATAEYPFDGRFQKLDSLLAGFASAYFSHRLPVFLPEKTPFGRFDERVFVAPPTFDARSFVVPSLLEAYHCFLWRQQDCVKNAISMAAQSMFPHKELQGLHGPEMQELMFSKFGVNFNDYPAFFKRGQFARRVKTLRHLTEQELDRIPPVYHPTGPVERSFVTAIDIWLSKQEDPVGVLFQEKDPTC